MSTLHDYSTTELHYDQTRQAQAYEIWFGSIERYALVKLGQARVLDAGTGNYTALLGPHVGQLNAFMTCKKLLQTAIFRDVGNF